MTLEHTVENYLVKRVKEVGGIALKGDVPGRRFLDRICIMPGGKVYFVELKRPKGGQFSAHQIETMKRLTDLGQIVIGVKNKEDVDFIMDLWEAHRL